MKKQIAWALASVISLGGIGAASAADLAVKAPPMAPPVPLYNWTGFYIGLNAGAAINDSRVTVEPTGCFTVPAVLCGGPLSNNPLRTDTATLSGVGFTGGGQIGYNWQAAQWLFGIETDLNYNGVHDTDTVSRTLAAPLVGIFNHTETDRPGWFGTLRGRVGWLATPTFLLYATGGLAYGQVKSASTVMFTAAGDTYVGSTDSTRVGWTAGAGGEWMVAPNWSVKAEYLFVDLGTVHYTDACVTPAGICGGSTPAPSYQTDLSKREHIVRVGVNYHFGGPVVARY